MAANQQQPTTTRTEQEESKERERMFNELKQEYFDIIDEVPLEIDRKLSLISQLENSLEECKIELHEDLMEYTRFTQSVTTDGTSSDPIASSSNQPDEEDDDDDEETLKNQLLVLAQPMLWGVVKVPTTKTDSDRRKKSALPIELRTLLTEISTKMNRLTKLSREKLEISESIYQQLDSQLKRLDNDLQDLQDARSQLVPNEHGPSAQDKQEQETESSSRSPKMMDQVPKDHQSQSSTPRPKRTHSTRIHPKTPTPSDLNSMFNSCNNNLTPNPSIFI